MFDVINDDNFFLYAAKNYDNPSCTGLDDFYEDLNHIKYIKRLLNRFTSKGELKEGLIINHILSIYNIFGNDAGTKILFFKLEEEYWSQLKTFLVWIDRLPEIIYGIAEKENKINTVDIPIDTPIANRLRKVDGIS